MTFQDHCTQDRALWMTLLDALQYIREVTKCGWVQAQVWLKNAIGSGKIAVRWSDATGPDDIVHFRSLRSSQFVLVQPGFAPDGLRLRPLLVLRSELKAITSTRGFCDPATDTDEPKWMTLVEAVEQIRLINECTQMEALQQLKAEIHGGSVPVKWDADDDVDDMKCVPETNLAFLLWGQGLAPDKQKYYHKLLCERFAVCRLWKSHSGSAKAGPLKDIRDTPNQGKRRKKGRPSDEELIYKNSLADEAGGLFV